MRMLFIDEAQCTERDKDFFAVAGLLLHSSSYKKTKESFDKSIESVGWNPDEEFKGKMIFSTNKGDKSVLIDDRIKIAQSALDGLSSEKRSRCKFWMCHNNKGKTEANYIELVSKIVSILPAPETGAGKNLLLIAIDKTEFDNRKIIEAIKANIKPGYVIIEDPYFLESKTSYCGLALVDIIAYLKTWTILITEEKAQLELFLRGVSDTNKMRRQTAKSLLEAVKNIKVTTV